VSRRHQHAFFGKNERFFGPQRQIDLKNATLGCRRDTATDEKTANIYPKTQYLTPNGKMNGFPALQTKQRKLGTK
jgi:hypothetical protein